MLAGILIVNVLILLVLLNDLDIIVKELRKRNKDEV